MNTRQRALPSRSAPSTRTAAGAVLQLAASQGQLSLQLQQPVTVGPLVLSQLVVSLPGLRFPVDLSGGVDRFRNRRGALEALTLQASLAALASHLAPRVRNVLGPEPCELVVLAAEHGLVFGLHEGPRALSFHAVFAPDDDTVRWVVTEARAVGLAVHSHGAALRAAEAMAGRHGSRTGSVVVFERGLQQLVREVLIDAGARAPETAAVRFSGWQETEGGWELEARRDAPVPALPAVVVRALETARIAERGDELLAAGELLEARAAYLSALEAAPRHPELSLRLAEADLLAQHGAENALALLIEAMPAVDGGNVAARLLAACGDRDGAMVATRRAADREPHGRHAALLLVEASEHASGLSERLSLLDEAAARSPGLLQARWARARARLEAGNVRGAAADLGDIEAGTRGSAKRYEACYAAGQLLLEGLAPAEAARFYQKALRYGPGSPEASVALARALLATGDGARAVALLSRAVGLARRTPAAPDVVLELARCLAGITQDLPTAIAHARSVPFGVPESIDARALEGRWRGALGDIAGASLCYAQAREAIEAMPGASPKVACAWLVEAARFELDVRSDPRTAQRHLAVALQRSPHDAAARALFRTVGLQLGELDRATAPQRRESITAEAPEPPAAPTEPPPQVAPGQEPDLLSAASEDAEAEIARLSQLVQGNPQDGAAVMRLCGLLETAGKHLELFALTSARLEEAGEHDDTAALGGYRASALQALARVARAEGRADEAQLYEDALQGQG